MDSSLFKNPILLGIVAGFLLYGYYWYIRNENIKEMRQKYYMYPESESMLEYERISIIKPVLFGIFVWFIANWYFTKKSVESYMKYPTLSETSEEFVVSIVPLC